MPAWAQPAPHRAAYTLSLADPKSSGLTTFKGGVYIQVHETCDLWLYEDRWKSETFTYDGRPFNEEAFFSSWESKDGTRYGFSQRSWFNGELTEEILGSAQLDVAGGEGRATFIKPKKETFELPAGTMFLTGHWNRLVEKARAGEAVFSQPVFVGDEFAGAVLMHVLITGRAQSQRPLHPRISADLVDHPSWNAHVAAHRLQEQTTEPEWESTVRVLDSGIELYRFSDYWRASIKAELTELEALPKPRC